MADFYTLLTLVGQGKLANGQVTGIPVQFTHMAVGDGLNGAYYNPSEDQEALKHEIWRGAINQIYLHPDNPNWIVAEVVIPTDAGPFYVREVGIFDADGDMIAVGKYPETYKPVLAGGAAKDLNIRMVLEVSNTAVVTLKIDPAIVLSTRSFVDSSLVEAGYGLPVSLAVETSLNGAHGMISVSEGAPLHLPTYANVSAKKYYTIKNVDPLGGLDSVIDAPDGKAIDGEASISIMPGQSVRLYKHNNNWQTTI